jgi:hypothetical protein
LVKGCATEFNTIKSRAVAKKANLFVFIVKIFSNLKLKTLKLPSNNFMRLVNQFMLFMDIFY